MLKKCSIIKRGKKANEKFQSKIKRSQVLALLHSNAALVNARNDFVFE